MMATRILFVSFFSEINLNKNFEDLGMEIKKTRIEGLFTLSLGPHLDHRGFFVETFRMSRIREALPSPKPFVQGCHSQSKKNVLRGLHAEPWDKFVYVPRGKVFTAVVDLRKESPSFGKSQTFLLGDGNRMSVYVPKGVAHGFLVLSKTADYTYLFTEEYSNSPRVALRWDDPNASISWPVKRPILSDQDKKNPSLKDLFPKDFE
jgi:dTDP-4-dehydrorhamnose 3,5-epimerase